MGVRFYEYTLVKGDKMAKKVVTILSDSYVKALSALGLLTCLAKDGHEFVVECRGDYNTRVTSKDLDFDPDPWIVEWYEQIKKDKD